MEILKCAPCRAGHSDVCEVGQYPDDLTHVTIPALLQCATCEMQSTVCIKEVMEL
jgi:hypothetical protein